MPRDATPRKASASSIAFDCLPEDLQVLIWQFMESDDGVERSPPRFLPTRVIPVAGIPVAELDPYDRGRDHAHSMDLTTTPPVVMAYGHFIDGKHRAFRARHLRWEHLVAIDLTDIITPGMAESNSLGPVDLDAPVIRSDEPIPSPYAEPDAAFAEEAVRTLLSAFEETDDPRFPSHARDAVDQACRALPGLYAELDWKVRDRAPEFADTALRVAASIVEAGVRTAWNPTREDLAAAHAIALEIPSPALTR